MLRRLIFCSTVLFCSLTVAASAADRPHKSPFRASPLAAPHHGSINAGAKKAPKPVKVASKKSHFWSR